MSAHRGTPDPAEARDPITFYGRRLDTPPGPHVAVAVWAGRSTGQRGHTGILRMTTEEADVFLGMLLDHELASVSGWVS